MSNPSWHVLGAGAMGCLFAAGLTAGGCDIHLLLRRRNEITDNTIRVDAGELQHSYTVSLDDSTGTSPIQHLLVCTKAYDMVSAVQGVRHRLTPETPLVLAANGMGYLEAIEALLPNNPIYCCLSTEGAYRRAPLHICHAGQGQNWLGSPSRLPRPDWFVHWQSGPLECHWQDDILSAQWHKLALNCAVNPLTALHRCSNGALLRQPELKQQLSQLIEEISLISAAAGFDNTAASLRNQAEAVITNTAANRSSMLQDVEAGRSTEIDYITGYLLRTAERLGVNAPLNRKLYQEIIALG